MNKKEIQRTEKIEIRVTESEKKIFKKKVEMAGFNLSEYVREYLENGHVKLSEDSSPKLQTGASQEEKKVLYGLANNINQLTKMSHQNKKIHPDVERILEKIKTILIPHFY